MVKKTLMVALFILSGAGLASGQDQDKALTEEHAIMPDDKINVTCQCKTKANPSWCALNTGQWETSEWQMSPYKNENTTWDEKFLRDYCYRKRNDEKANCLCDNPDLFSGRVN